jgi:hypothetical protein
MENLTTLYYGMQNENEGFISMPIIAEKKDCFAVVEFRSKAGIGSFKHYKHATAFQNLQKAIEKCSKRNANVIYKLSPERPIKDTRLHCMKEY